LEVMGVFEEKEARKRGGEEGGGGRVRGITVVNRRSGGEGRMGGERGRR